MEKTKACFTLKSLLGKEISSDSFLANILCRNRADKSETLVRKLHEVRESFKSLRKAIVEEKGGITSTEWQACAADRDTGKEKIRSDKRALFVARDDHPLFVCIRNLQVVLFIFICRKTIKTALALCFSANVYSVLLKSMAKLVQTKLFFCKEELLDFTAVVMKRNWCMWSLFLDLVDGN